MLRRLTCCNGCSLLRVQTVTPTDFLDRKFASDKPRNCWMCACALTRWSATVDHLKPKSMGGQDNAGNYKLACKPCNNARGNKPIPRKMADALKGRQAPKQRDFSALAAAIQRNRING